jgi:outer membrane murein-binding lipoprotein Lpp
MKQMFVLVSLLLSGLIVGCASDTDLHAIQADTSGLQRQNTQRHQTVEARVQQLGERVAQFEQSQLAARRDLARINATLDELRVNVCGVMCRRPRHRRNVARQVVRGSPRPG